MFAGHACACFSLSQDCHRSTIWASNLPVGCLPQFLNPVFSSQEATQIKADFESAQAAAVQAVAIVNSTAGDVRSDTWPRADFTERESYAEC